MNDWGDLAATGSVTANPSLKGGKIVVKLSLEKGTILRLGADTDGRTSVWVCLEDGRKGWFREDELEVVR